ncbi:hypothetical protein Alsa3_CDS0167 [Staphylococcus phage Alsa_3]|nr:hypothetical protein Alsa3_CDS0167 [Staphylococcus phage Alsa_3]WNM51292.1 hypothetical protein Alsa4_CDS0162 [Staphylococcus phage Alsa_4]
MLIQILLSTLFDYLTTPYYLPILIPILLYTHITILSTLIAYLSLILTTLPNYLFKSYIYFILAIIRMYISKQKKDLYLGLLTILYLL